MSKRDDSWPAMPLGAPENFESWLTDPITVWFFDILRKEESSEKNALVAATDTAQMDAVPLMFRRGGRASNLNWIIHGLPKQMEKKVKGAQEREAEE